MCREGFRIAIINTYTEVQGPLDYNVLGNVTNHISAMCSQSPKVCTATSKIKLTDINNKQFNFQIIILFSVAPVRPHRKLFAWKIIEFCNMYEYCRKQGFYR